MQLIAVARQLSLRVGLIGRCRHGAIPRRGLDCLAIRLCTQKSEPSHSLVVVIRKPGIQAIKSHLGCLKLRQMDSWPGLLLNWRRALFLSRGWPSNSVKQQTPGGWMPVCRFTAKTNPRPCDCAPGVQGGEPEGHHTGEVQPEPGSIFQYWPA